MRLERAQALCTALLPDRVLRLARGVLGADPNKDLNIHQVLSLAIANWLEGYRICDEAQTMLFFSEFGDALKWYADEISLILEANKEADSSIPYLVMLHDYRYFLTHNYKNADGKDCFFDIREAQKITELPATTVTYVSVDCLALMNRVQEADAMLDRLEQDKPSVIPEV